VSALFLVMPMKAQESDVPVSAGTDFYFTTFEHSSLQTLFLQLVAIGPTTMNIWVDNQLAAINNDPFGACLGPVVNVNPLQTIHVQTSEPCYLSAFVKGSTAGAETAILPTHLLGTSYMLQGVPGSLIELDGVPTQTYSQFSIVGTENNTTVSIKSPVQLRCVTNNRPVYPNYTTKFLLSKGQALFFQPEDYTQDISGVHVKSTYPVAVFQGNNLTRIYPGENWADYTWEQARPTTEWGTDFIIPKSALLQFNIPKVTALYDNTDVYCWVNGTRMFMKTLQAGESYARVFDTGTSGTLDAVHIQTTKPACCYLYFTGSTRNNEVGDPSMVEITPMDNPSTDSRWILTQPADNAPYKMRLLVTCRLDNEANVLLNNLPLGTYATDEEGSTTRLQTNEYVTYEFAYSAAQSMHLQAIQGGFSAYTLHVGNVAEASAFSVSLPEKPYKPELCLDGQLLFREDFGGNDPDDPVVSTTPVSGMSDNYRQITNIEYKGNNQDMGAGRYLVAKRGYRNSTNPNYSVWHIMDDHTYFGDTTRGYFLEVDGMMDGNDVFYSTTLDGLCAGSQLSFSAYVANLTTAAQYNGWRYDSWRGYEHPKLKFVISNPQTNEVIAQYNTDTIAHDWSLFGTPSSWKHSADWQQIGMNFIVPEEISEVRLSIVNNAHGSTGNDFALDDIEVRLCVPSVTILAPDTVCIDTKNTFVAELGEGGMFTEPLEYQWYFSADSVTWTPVNEGDARELKLKAKPWHTGWYKVAVAGAGSINSTNCRAISEPFYFYVIEDCPPILCPEGVLLLQETFRDSVTLCDTVIDGLCAGMDLSLIVNLPPNHGDTRLMFRLSDPVTGTDLAAYDTGNVPPDSLLVGTSFYIPDTVSALRWTVRNNGSGASGKPFALENREIRLCLEPVSVAVTENPACRKRSVTLQALYENYGILESPEYRWSYSSDSLTWTDLQTSSLKTYTIPEVHRSHEGFYTVTVADAGNMDSPNCRETSEPFRLSTVYCNTAVDQFIDTVICDTMLSYDHIWRGHEWHAVGEVTDTIKDFEDDDSLYIHLALDTRVCCPDIEYFRLDTAICDTLLPFLWRFNDTTLLFADIGEQTVDYQHGKWSNCTGEIHTLVLDTFHCERLYPIIVNKYNWQLLLDHVTLHRLFPDLSPEAYQWYRDSVRLDGAVDDDYSEHNELYGNYQLRVQMNDGLYVWSNVISIHDTPSPLPVTERIYNSQGLLVSEDQMKYGVFLIQYQQGDRVWTEKKFVP